MDITIAKTVEPFLKIPLGASGVIISRAKAHTHITNIVESKMFFTDVIPLMCDMR